MFKKTVLPNGVRVVTETIPYVKSVSLGFWLGTGSRYEDADNHGVAHFIEHLLFKGTEKRSAKDIAEAADEIGGQMNAFTAKECTCYYMRVLDYHLPRAFDILSDMLMNSTFKEDDVEREREVVLEEEKMVEDTPDDLVHELHFARSWSDHRLGSSILGTAESIVGLDRAKAKRFFGEFYVPDNLVVAAAGNVEHEALVALCSEGLSSIQGKRRKTDRVAPIVTPHVTLREKDIEQVHLCLGTASMGGYASGIYTVHLLNNILGGGISSRLYQSIREERGLVYTVFSAQSGYSDGGLITVYAGMRPANATQVIELVLREIAAIKTNGVTETELLRTKDQLKGGMLLGLESSGSRMSRIGKLETILGRQITIDEVVAQIDSVTIADIQEMAQRIFCPQGLCLTALGPIAGVSLPTKLDF